MPRDLYLKAAVRIVSDFDLVYEVKTECGPILIHCDSETVRSRAEHMLTREPDTLAWVDSFAPDDVLYDVGSNIGVFSLYAAVARRARVVAFDPLPFNYAGLCRNIALNKVDDRVMPFCLAVTDQMVVSTLYVPQQAFTPGGSASTFGDEPRTFGIALDTAVTHTAIGIAIDDFIDQFDVPFPNHIKMDIDGIQDKVIKGARETLRDPRLKTAMLELPPDRSMIASIHAEMRAADLSHTKTCPTAPGGGTDTARVDTNHFFAREP